MKALIISDIHLRWKIVDRILNTVKADRVVFLGDLFDQFNDTPGATKEMAEWVKKVASRDDVEFLFGNHDVPYWQPSHACHWCPGFSYDKSRIINDIIPSKLWETKWNFVWFEQGWTLSHAGFHKHALPCYPDMDVVDQAYIARAADEAFGNIMEFRNHPILHQGTRMGSVHVGGCTWLDWGDFEPIGELNQIVGHSPRRTVVCKHLSEDGKIITQGNIHSLLKEHSYENLEGLFLNLTGKEYRD